MISECSISEPQQQWCCRVNPDDTNSSTLCYEITELALYRFQALAKL